MADTTPKPLPDIVFNDWVNGIADSPFLGAEVLINADIFSAQGVLRQAFKMTVQGQSNIDLPKWIVRDPGSTGDIYALDAQQELTISLDGGVTWSGIAGSLSAGTGNGLTIYKGYVIVVGTSQIDVLLLGSGTPNRVVGWQTLLISNGNNPALWGQDDIMYIGDGNSVASVMTKSGKTFQPFETTLNGNINASVTTIVVTSGTTITNGDIIIIDQEQISVSSGGGTASLVVVRGANGTTASSHTSGAYVIDKTNPSTYSYTAVALQLPTNVYISALEELGVNLLVGTFNNGVGPLVSKVFPWDRSSPTFNLPWILSGDGVNAEKTLGQITYLLPGKTGAIYVGNGYATQKIKQLHIENQELIVPNPAGIDKFGDKIIFAFGNGTTYPTGVYQIDPMTGVLSCIATISTGNYDNGVTLGAVYTISETQFLVGWKDSHTGTVGIDLYGKSGYRAAKTVYRTRMAKLGTANSQHPVQSIEVTLEKPIVNGQTFTVGYRTNRTASMTLIPFNGSTTIGYSSFLADKQVLEIPFGGSFKNLQLELTLMPNGGTDTQGLAVTDLRAR